MIKNNVRTQREAAGLTQSQLADLVETSQPEINRVEAGIQTVRLDLALQIAAALRTNLQKLFPELRTALRGVKRDGSEISGLDNAQLREQAAAAGVDADPRYWYLQVLVRGAAKPRLFDISSQDRDRLHSLLQARDDKREFLRFSTVTHEVCLNPRHVVYARLLFEPFRSFEAKPATPRDDDRNVSAVVALQGIAEPIQFPTNVDWDDPGYAEFSAGPLDAILVELESGAPDEDETVAFEDASGEWVFVSVPEIAILEVPQLHLHPEL